MFLVCYCAVVTCGLLSAQRCLPHLPPDAHVQERKLKKQQRQDATSALAAAHQSARGEAGLSVSNIQKILDDIDAMTGVDLQHHADEFGIESGGAGESGEDTDGDVEHGDALDVAALRAKLRTHLQSLLHSQTQGSAGGKKRGRQAHAASKGAMPAGGVAEKRRKKKAAVAGSGGGGRDRGEGAGVTVAPGAQITRAT